MDSEEISAATVNGNTDHTEVNLSFTDSEYFSLLTGATPDQRRTLLRWTSHLRVVLSLTFFLELAKTTPFRVKTIGYSSDTGMLGQSGIPKHDEAWARIHRIEWGT